MKKKKNTQPQQIEQLEEQNKALQQQLQQLQQQLQQLQQQQQQQQTELEKINENLEQQQQPHPVSPYYASYFEQQQHHHHHQQQQQQQQPPPPSLENSHRYEEGTEEERRQRAHNFLDGVKNRFSEQYPLAYDRILELVKQLKPPQEKVISEIANLLQGHGDLIAEINYFLPNYKIIENEPNGRRPPTWITLFPVAQPRNTAWWLVWKEMKTKMTKLKGGGKGTMQSVFLRDCPRSLLFDLFGPSNDPAPLTSPRVVVSLSTMEEVAPFFAHLRKPFRHGGYAEVVAPVNFIFTRTQVKIEFHYCPYDYYGKVMAWVNSSRVAVERRINE